MPASSERSWLRRRVEKGLMRGLTRAYDTVKVNPDKFLIQLRAAYDLPVTSFQGVYTVELGYLDEVAASIVRSSMKMASVQGAGLNYYFVRAWGRRAAAHFRARHVAARGSRAVSST